MLKPDETPRPAELTSQKPEGAIDPFALPDTTGPLAGEEDEMKYIRKVKPQPEQKPEGLLGGPSCVPAGN